MKIDILLATYNGEKYLKEQLDSILMQTYKNFRLIISDDNSSDNTRQILEEYEKKDDRIEVYYQEKNLGYIKNFEFLLNKVENEIYALSDQDDVWNLDKIEKTYNKMIKENADLVFTDLEVVDENLNTLYPSFNDYFSISRKIKKYTNSYKLQYLYNCITGCTLMSKKIFIDDILPFPSKAKYVIHDAWIGMVVSLKGKVEYLDEKTIKYRQHGNNQIGINKATNRLKNPKEIRDFFIEIRTEFFNIYVENENLFDEKLRKQNKEALEYLKMLPNKKYINFSKLNVFHKLYKDESFFYYIKHFIVFNIPILGNLLYRIKNVLIKER